MAIRDGNNCWTNESVKFSNNLKPILRDSLNKALSLGFTIEDWFYLVTTEANEVIMEKTLWKE